MRRVLRAALLAAAAVAATGGAAVAWFLRQSRPITSGLVAIPELCHPVSVVRDTWGIPHVFAEDSADLFVATGFVQAQDRLWQMEMMRRLAEGRVAEVLGPRAVPTDLMSRTLDIAGAAETAWGAMDAEQRQELASFADGVNAFLRSQRDRLPLEFRILRLRPETWRPAQSVYPHLLSAYLYSHNLNEELFFLRVAGRLGNRVAAELVPTAGRASAPREAAVLPDYRGLTVARAAGPLPWPAFAGIAEASNAWVVDGTKSVSGKPILASDPHTYLYIPSIVYEMGLHGGGRDVFGYFAAGSPYAAIGRNGRIAWAAAAVEADLIDLFVERLSPDGRSYLDQGAPRPLGRREIRIGVARRDAPVVAEVLSTSRGPLLNSLLGSAARHLPFPMVPSETPFGVSMSWVAAKVVDASARAYSRLNRASSWDEFRDALADLRGVSFHFLYADRDGHVGWQMTGRLPVRKRGTGKYPSPGWTGEFGWTGLVPFEELPYQLDPSDHQLVIANHDVLPPGYPHPVSNSWFGPYRAQRITELLGSRERFSVEDFRRMQLDVYSPVAARLRELLAPLHFAEPQLERAVESLRRWDGRMQPDSGPAALAWAVQEALWDELFRPVLSEDAVHLRLAGDGHYNVLEALLDDPAAPWWGLAAERTGLDRDELLRRAVRAGVARLAREQGGEASGWRWDAQNRLNLVHQPLGRVRALGWLFNRGPYGVGGDPNTLNVMRVDPYTGRPRIGAVFRMIVDMADPDRGIAMASTGESGHPLSRHYDDMLAAWARGEYHPIPFTREAAAAAQESMLRLVP